MIESKDDFVADDLTPDDDFVADDFTPDEAPKEERSALAKAGRIGAQYGIGRLEGTPAGIAYEIGVSPANSPAFYTNIEMQRLGEDIEFLYEKNLGKPFEEWSDQDKAYYNSFETRLKNPAGIAKEFEGKTTDLSIRGIASKLTGVNLHPEDVWEKAASWAGFVKDPKKVKDLLSLGVKPKELTKAILPYPHEIFRGIGAGTAMQLAEDGQFGPIGSLAAVILGDVIGHAPKGIAKVAANPKQAAAHAINILTMNNTQKLSAMQLAEDFAKSNIQADAGTLTGSPLVQMMQARLSQSGLTGNSLDNFRKELSGQIVREYESILGDIGELTFENNYQASEAIKDALKVKEVNLNTPKADLNKQAKEARSLAGRVAVEERPDYQNNLLQRISPEPTRNDYVGGENLKTAADDIRRPIKEEFNQRWTDFNQQAAGVEAGPQQTLVNSLETFVNDHRGSLLLGESTAEANVLRTAENLLNQLRVPGGFRGVSLDALIKTKRTLSDIADWEMYGSDFTSAYKQLVNEVDGAIYRVLAEHPELQDQFLRLNADYSAFKTAFEDKNLKKLFDPTNFNYNTIYKEFVNNPDKLRSLEDILYNNPRGEQLINQIKRDYAQEVIQRPNLTARDIQNLQQVLGPEFDGPILEFVRDRQQALEHPLPRAQQQPAFGAQVPIERPNPNAKLAPSRVSETGTERAREGLRRKMEEKLKNKDGQFKKPDEILRNMDSVEGIRELRKALSTTEEGKELFKELSRYKLAELIDKKMKNTITENINLGNFSKLLDTKKTKEIVQELLSPSAYDRLILLQKNSGRLAKSAAKFLNTSQSGTTLVDMGLVGAAASGILLGNPYMAVPAMLKIGGSYVMAKLLSDPKFLKELEKAIQTNYPKQFKKSLEAMRPTALKAIKEIQEVNEGKDV